MSNELTTDLAELVEATDHAIIEATATPSVRLAMKIATMLALRANGVLTPSADDYISGLVCAYGMVVGIVGDSGAAMRAANDELDLLPPPFTKEG